MLLAALLAAGPLAAQYRAARSLDYQFAAGTADARALWVNPAGLGVEYEASVMAELLMDRSQTGDLSLNQFSGGFNSRGISFGYRRDAYNDTLTGHTYRIGLGRAVERFALGASLTFHNNAGGPVQRGLDLGIRYRLLRAVELGVVVREIGRPIVHEVPLPLNGSAGLGLQLTPGIRLDAEGTLSDLPGPGGTATLWRGGLSLGNAGLSLPIGFQAVLDMDRDLAPTRLILALTLGGQDRGVLVASGARPGGTAQLQAISLAGVASRVP